MIVSQLEPVFRVCFYCFEKKSGLSCVIKDILWETRAVGYGNGVSEFLTLVKKVDVFKFLFVNGSLKLFYNQLFI